MISLLRWTARLLSLVSIVMLAMFIVADVPIPGRVATRVWIGLVFFPVGVIVGMLIAWRREGLGAVIGLTSLACFYGIYGLWLMGSSSLGWWFVIFSSPLLLFLLTWALSRLSERGASRGLGRIE